MFSSNSPYYAPPLPRRRSSTNNNTSLERHIDALLNCAKQRFSLNVQRNQPLSFLPNPRQVEQSLFSDESSGSSSAAASSSTRRYTVAWDPQSGTTFQFIAEELLRSGYWHYCGTVSTKKRKLVCCDRLNGINLYLGTKHNIDELMGETRILQMRERRMSTCLGVVDTNACRHAPSRTLSTCPDRRLLNYLEGSKSITLKARMVKTFRDNNRDMRTSEYMPQTFVVTPRWVNGAADHRESLFKTMTTLGREAALDTVHWIVKSSHGCGGSAVKIFRNGDVDDMMRYIDGQREATPWVVQRYISRPFLFKGRKFDIRSWVLATSDQRIFVYREGVMRTSSQRYDMTNLDDALVHVTNHCIQQKGESYSQHEPGNEVFYAEFDEFLATQSGTRRRCVQRDILPSMHSIVVETMAPMLRDVVSKGVVTDSFQLFGFDFILGEDWKLWLLEINGSPAIAEGLVGAMIKDLIRLVVAPVFPPPSPPIPESSSTRVKAAPTNNGFVQVFPSTPTNSTTTTFLSPRIRSQSLPALRM